MRWCWLLLASGCVAAQSKSCPDSVVCPSGTTCASITVGETSLPYCATDAELAACRGLADGVACTRNSPGDGTCHGGICTADRCGNLLVDQGEMCDDGNTTDGIDGPDACSADCGSTQVCGNGVVDQALREDCDAGPDGIEHDGCS